MGDFREWEKLKGTKKFQGYIEGMGWRDIEPDFTNINKMNDDTDAFSAANEIKEAFYTAFGNANVLDHVIWDGLNKIFTLESHDNNILRRWPDCAT